MSETKNFPIAAIGASAGGIEALEGFFHGLPPEPGVALVILTHLSPERESLLHEIIARYTSLPVHIAADHQQVEVNAIYVLPADAILTIEHRCLMISRNANRRERHPIDVFFSSLANDVGEFAAILTACSALRQSRNTGGLPSRK